MTALARHLETIDLLRARGFPAQRARSAFVVSGPGFHIAELATSEEFWEDDGSGRLAAVEQYEAEHRALSLLLSERWGEPQVFSLWSTLVRSVEGQAGEENEQPWLELSTGVPCLDLWRVEERWIALGVSQQDAELPFQLLAAVTVNDPP
jgi:hypothetical protein